MKMFNRIFLVFFLAALTLSGGAAEVRRTLLAGDAVQGWEYPAQVRRTGSEFRIPAGSGGEVLSPRFALPEPRQEMMIGFDFRTSPEFEPGNWKMYVKVVWLDGSGRVIGRHHQHPWFVFPASALNGKWVPFHRPVTAECVPENAVSARLRFSCSGTGGKGNLTVRNVSFVSFYRLRAEKFANWFEPGEPIVFRGTLPPEFDHLKGVVTASDGTTAAERTVARKELEQNGWSCRLSRPGFYTVRFFYENSSGETVPVVQEYYAQRINGNRLVEERKFEREIQNFVVTATKARPVEQVPPQLGISLAPRDVALPYRLGSNIADDFRMRRLIGYHFMRLHALSWDEIEKSPGVYDWSIADKMFETAARNSIPQSRIDVVLLDTPRFYTNRPDNTAEMSYSARYQFYPPNDWGAWERFVTAAVKRYPQVRSWEIWNEPHLPGHSIFWKGTPEDYRKMLEIGYRAVKKASPGKPVAFGGVGMRYQAFYRRILELGGGGFFDILPLHGTWADPEPYVRIGKEFNAGSKQYVNNEWHLTLFTSSDPVILSEEQLSFNMVLDFLNMFRSGIEKAAFHNGFGPRWHGGTEREMAGFRRPEGAQIEGIFRTFPNQEPKFAAFVLRNLYDRFSGHIQFRGAYTFGSGDVQAAVMESASGPLLIFWNMGKNAAPLPTALVPALRSARVLDWEGRPVKNPPSMRLAPQVVYYAEKPELSGSGTWSVLSRIEPYQESEEMEYRFRGSYQEKNLFSDGWNLRKDLRWIPLTEYFSLIPSGRPSSYGGRFAVSLNPSGLELCVEVRDAVHTPVPDHERGKPIPYWMGDSLQFAIDCEGKGQRRSMTEFIFSSHNHFLSKVMMASVGGDIPERLTQPGEVLKYGAGIVERRGDLTIYKLRIAASELYPFTLDPGKPRPLRFSLLVNNNDGSGRVGYLTWGGGIGDRKSPAKFGTLALQGSGRTLAVQKDLRNRFQQSELSFDSAAGTVKVVSTLKQKQGAVPMAGSGIASVPVNVVPGMVYQVSCEVRGTGRLEAFLAGKGIPRWNFPGTPLNLTASFVPLTGEIQIPLEGETMQCFLFTWRQIGTSFEVRNFRIREKTE